MVQTFESTKDFGFPGAQTLAWLDENRHGRSGWALGFQNTKLFGVDVPFLDLQQLILGLV